MSKEVLRVQASASAVRRGIPPEGAEPAASNYKQLPPSSCIKQLHRKSRGRRVGGKQRKLAQKRLPRELCSCWELLAVGSRPKKVAQAPIHSRESLRMADSSESNASNHSSSGLLMLEEK